MFKRLSLDLKPDTFNDLIAANEWETYDRNRQGAVLVRHEQGLEHDYTPFVRTTTVCTMPSQPFSPLHFAIIDQIKELARHPLDWNNAAAEVYDPGYKTMRFHCDQGLDLRPGSYIGIFSCYDDPKEPCPRRLVTRRKDGKATSEVFLAHNSAVLFSTVTNDQYVHKIVGSGCTSKWLGVTFRTSHTFVDDDKRLVHNWKPLTLATEEETVEFCRHKSMENSCIGYKYPDISYSLSSVV